MILVVVCESVFCGLAGYNCRLFMEKNLSEQVNLAKRPKQFTGIFL